jgi:hypothetical protein
MQVLLGNNKHNKNPKNVAYEDYQDLVPQTEKRNIALHHVYSKQPIEALHAGIRWKNQLCHFSNIS